MHNMFMKDFSNEQFGKRLKRARKFSGLTQQQTADALCVALRSYQHYESGDRFPSSTLLRNISKLLDVSTDYLLCLTDEVPFDE